MKYDFPGCLKKIVNMAVQEVGAMQHLISGNGHQMSHAQSTAKQSISMTRVLQPVHTIRLRPDMDEQATRNFPVSATITNPLPWYGITDTGRVRGQNEDSFSLLELPGKTLFVVADGMGGHEAGEVASRIATETVCRVVQEDSLEGRWQINLVESAVQKANREVRLEGVRRGVSMGTTLSVALVVDDIAYIANVGDSRVYWIENGSISQITTDHSLVAKLVALGRLAKEEAKNHPQSNLLLRTIGTDDALKVDTFRIKLRKGGTLLLCTDGLWGEIPDEEIHRICTREKDAESVGTRLVQRANERGGKDNITAVVFKIS